MQAGILGRRRSTGRRGFEEGSEMKGMQRKQTGGRRESARMWGDWPDVDTEEEDWREESPLEHVRIVVGVLLPWLVFCYRSLNA